MGCVIAIIAFFQNVAVVAPLYFEKCPEHTDPVLLCRVALDEHNQPLKAVCTDLHYKIIYQGNVSAVGPNV